MTNYFSPLDLREAAEKLLKGMDDGEDWTVEEMETAIEAWLEGHIDDVFAEIEWWAFGPRPVGNLYKDLAETREKMKANAQEKS